MQHDSVFFSYARDDGEFALRLARDLKDRGIKVWIDQIDIEPGERWDRAIEAALHASPSFLVILSPAAVESANVLDEASYALEEGKTTIPVLYRDCRIPFRLRRLQRIDLAADYAGGLDRLVRALGGSSPAKPLPRETAQPEVHAAAPDAGFRSRPPAEAHAPDREAPPTAPEKGRPGHRWAGVLPGALLGAGYGGIAAFVIYLGDSRFDSVLSLLAPIGSYGGIAAVAGAIAGAIVGRSPMALILIAAAVTAVSVTWVGVWGTYADVVATGMVLGGGATAVIVAAIWKLIRGLRKR